MAFLKNTYQLINHYPLAGPCNFSTDALVSEDANQQSHRKVPVRGDSFSSLAHIKSSVKMKSAI